MKSITGSRVRICAAASCAALSLVAALANGDSTNPAPVLPAVRAIQTGNAARFVQAPPETGPRQRDVLIPLRASTDVTDRGSLDDVSRLRSRGLTIPLPGIYASQLMDTYTQARGGGAAHEALDIMAPRGTPVLAVEDGRVAKLFLSKPGGITLYQFDPDGEYVYYYAHLDRYADHIKEGDVVRSGQVIGYVGITGNALPDAPHLHFAVGRLGPERRWWRSTPINPFFLWRDGKS